MIRKPCLACSTIISVLLLPTMSMSQIPNGPYFGQSPPGLVPEVFAPGIISLDSRYEYGIAFSPDGTECCFGVTDASWSDCQLFYTRQTDSVWSTPAPADFQGGFDGWQPFFTYDGEQFMFSSGRPSFQSVNVYVCRKVYFPVERWTQAAILSGPVNDPGAQDWRPTTTMDGTLFFSSNRSGGIGNQDIWESPLTGGQYSTVQNLGDSVNSTSLDASPFISPDGSYLLFESHKAGGYGQADIYISFRKPDSTWTTPLNLGPTINTNRIDDLPWVSPDGNYLFFCRREAWVTAQQTDLYWVDMEALQLDVDFDSIPGPLDNCADIYNPAQTDSDADGVGDSCDNCVLASNLDQLDADGDLIGDVCDNCPAITNAGQEDGDSDGWGDLCDNCPSNSNPLQENADGDAWGDLCDACPAQATPENTLIVTGDATNDQVLNSADIVYLVNYAFKGGPAPIPIAAVGDVNCDDLVTSLDILHMVAFVFKSGAAPCNVCAL